MIATFFMHRNDSAGVALYSSVTKGPSISSLPSICLDSSVISYIIISFQLPLVSDNYTTVFIGWALKNDTILCYCISLLLLLLLLFVSTLHDRICTALSNIWDMVCAFIQIDFLSAPGHLGLSSYPQQRSALCAYSSLYIFLSTSHFLALPIPST